MVKMTKICGKCAKVHTEIPENFQMWEDGSVQFNCECNSTCFVPYAMLGADRVMQLALIEYLRTPAIQAKTQIPA